jgi:small subunit ribosomal protein S19
MPYNIGQTLWVHSGNKFLPIRINQDMIGHKLGEFVQTRKGKPFKK